MPAVNAATARVSEFRPEAVESDKEMIKEKLDSQITQILKSIKEYPEKAKMLLQYLKLEEELMARNLLNEDELGKICVGESLSRDFELLKAFINTFSTQDFSNLSLHSFTKLYQKRQEIPGILDHAKH